MNERTNQLTNQPTNEGNQQPRPITTPTGEDNNLHLSHREFETRQFPQTASLGLESDA